MDADTKRGADCDYPASWCLFPGCEKCRATHPGLGRLAAQGLHVVTAAGKAVLDAMAAYTETELHWASCRKETLANAIRLELARREAEKEKTK